LMEASDSVALVYEEPGRNIDGLILGRVMSSPPVYNPGGKACVIEDFVVATPAAWPELGAELIAAANDRVQQLGGVLLIVESMRAATAKRHMLFSQGFSLASDWLCRDIDLVEPDATIDGVIEPATATDVMAIVELSEMRRLQYERYQSVFWRKAADSAEKHAGFLSWLISDGKWIVLVHRTGTTIDGFIVANPSATFRFFDQGGASCNVDDFTVATDDLWPVGAWLLYTAVSEAKSRGAVVTQVICPHDETAKRRMLAQMGYRIGHEWLVRTTGPAAPG
jgi:hypothetical protein